MAKIIYLSGPISLGGTSTQEKEEKFKRAFTFYESKYAALGFNVINPCNCEPQENWEAYMKLHIPSVCKADLIGTLPRWIESRGSVLEVYIATQLKIPVVDVRDFHGWSNG